MPERHEDRHKNYQHRSPNSQRQRDADERQEHTRIRRMPHQAERPALHQFVIFLDRHIHGEEAAQRNDRPPAKQQSQREQHRPGDLKRSAMRQSSRSPIASYKNARHYTRHDDHPKDAQCAPVLLRPGAAARPARDRQQQLRNQINQPERKRDRHKEDFLSLPSLAKRRLAIPESSASRFPSFAISPAYLRGGLISGMTSRLFRRYTRKSWSTV